MTPISEQDFSRLADAVRRRRRATGSPEAVQAQERHSYRVISYVDDLAEGESVNAVDYSVVRAAAILHDLAAPKTRPSAVPEASAAIAADMLCACGADDSYVAAVTAAISKHAGAQLLDVEGGTPCDEFDDCAQMLVHDACLLARLEAEDGVDPERLHRAAASLCTKTARRIAATILQTASGFGERAPATIH